MHPGQRHPDFMIQTDRGKPLQVYKAATITTDGRYEGDPRIRGVATSTMPDTDGDRFMPSALKSLQDNMLGLNVLVEHKPSVFAIFGSVMDCALDERRHDGSIFDVLEVESDVMLKSFPARETYEMIAGIGTRPRQLGFSIGCIYTDVRRRQTKSFGRVGVDVYDAYPGEVSVIPMPSNRIAWIEEVKKSLKTIGVLPEEAETDDPNHRWWLDRDIQYVIARREDFVRTETDAEGLAVWKHLETIARFLDEELGVVCCLPRSR